MIKQALKKKFTKKIATRQTDPNYFYNTLHALPNPDEVLRKIGGTRDIYQEMMGDAHILGEINSMRAGVIGQEGLLLPGGDSPQDLLAFELCEKVLNRNPNNYSNWGDIFWNIAEATLKGFSVLEIVWTLEGDYYLPTVFDVPQRRFVFSPENKLRLLTKESPVNGIALGDKKWILSRHMPDSYNPYGKAVLSACFWPYTFKHAGFKYLVKFCEKYGIPWAIGKYPEGSSQEQQDELADGLAQMVEDSIAVIPAGGTVELVESKAGSNALAQERLVNLCNREISKAITSQTLATEAQGSGNLAAAETHHNREKACYAAERRVVIAKINQLLTWVTEINIVNAKPPTFCFYEETKPRKDWVEVLDTARNFLKIPEDFAYERLQIPKPKMGASILSFGFKDKVMSDQRAEFTQKPIKHLEQWIEIFRVGENKSSDGIARKFSLHHLDEIIRNFDPNDPAPYVIGHPKANDPAYGWVKELKRQGNELWARGTGIEPAFDKLIKEGRYRKRSVRIIPTEKGWKLIHIGFLGAVAPAISGLKDNWHFGEMANQTGYDYIFR